MKTISNKSNGKSDFFRNSWMKSKAIYRITKKLPIFPIICIAPLIIFGIFGPLLYTHDPHIIDLERALQAPAWMEGGSWEYLLGTDQLGRDLFSRMIEGAKASLIVAFFSVIFSGLIGVIIGLLAGFFGGKLDNILMRLTDIWMGIPPMFFLLILVALVRQMGIQGLPVIITAIAVTSWVPFAQMVRGETLSIKEREFVSLAKITGCSTPRIMRKHLFPNVMNTVVIIASGMMGGAIGMEAGASFLGVGVQPPNTAWGSLIAESSTYLSTAWWVPVFASVAITITILGFNMLGDWLRDVMDPRTRQAVTLDRSNN